MNKKKEKDNKKKKDINKKEKKKTKFDLDYEIEDLEDIIDNDYEDDKNKKKGKNKNKDYNDLLHDKEIKELMDAYEKQLNIEAEREVEKEYKPNIDENDVKRADKLLKKDPLINEALIQGLITKEELILL